MGINLKPARQTQSEIDCAPVPTVNSFSPHRTTFGKSAASSEGQKKFLGQGLQMSVFEERNIPGAHTASARNTVRVDRVRKLGSNSATARRVSLKQM